jgi:exocyst complex component 1
VFAINYQSTATTVLKTAIGVGEKSGGLFAFKKKNKKSENSSHTSGALGDEEDEIESSMMDNNEERMSADEALGHALLKLTTIMVREQNFVTDFFSIAKNVPPAVVKSTMDLTATTEEEETLEKWQENLGVPRQPFKESKAEKRIDELMDHLFEGIREMLMSVVDSGLKFEQSHSVGMMVKIEYHSKEYQKTSHTYVLNLLDSLLKRVLVTFDKFIDAQVKAIEDTRITTKKRNGILSFVRTFPVIFLVDYRDS